MIASVQIQCRVIQCQLSGYARCATQSFSSSVRDSTTFDGTLACEFLRDVIYLSPFPGRKPQGLSHFHFFSFLFLSINHKGYRSPGYLPVDGLCVPKKGLPLNPSPPRRSFPKHPWTWVLLPKGLHLSTGHRSTPHYACY